MRSLFSVVVPTFNRLEMLRETVAALEAQRGAPKFDIVIVDDGSTDATGDWLATRSFRTPATVLRQDNGGPAAARNAGVAAARGDYIAFLGDDTVPAPSWLAKHAEAHRRAEDPHVAVLGYTRWHGRMRITPFLEYLNNGGKQFGYALIRGKYEVPFNFFYTSNVSLSRELLLTEPFNVRFPLATWEDTECSYRLHGRGMRLVYEPNAVAEHYHPTDLESFCARHEGAGRGAVIFHELHPELGPFLGLGTNGPPPLPPALQYRMAKALARVVARLSVGRPRLWDYLLRYHYIIGLRRAWQDVPSREMSEQAKSSQPIIGTALPAVGTPPPSAWKTKLRVHLGKTKLRTHMSSWLRSRLNRSYQMTPLLDHDLMRESDEWVVTGRQPELRLHSNRAAFPHGWVRVGYEWPGHTGSAPLTLWAETSGGREETISLPATPGRATLIARLPAGVSGLRIRPPAGSTRFRLEAIEIVEMSAVHSRLAIAAPYLTAVRRDPRMIGHFVRRTVATMQRHGVRAPWEIVAGRFPSGGEERYAEWIRRFDQLGKHDRAAIAGHIGRLKQRPLLSLLLPLDDTTWLVDVIGSIRQQCYPNWELLLVPFGGGLEDLEALLREYTDDPRVHIVRSDGGVSRGAAANRALAAARGAFCSHLRSDVELSPLALYQVAAELDLHPGADLLYSDEDSMDQRRRRHHPAFKPDWDPDLLLGCDVVGRTAFYRTTLLRTLRGWREELGDCADWDLALRASVEVSEPNARHLPYVLYHAHRNETAPRQPDATKARRMLEEHLQRTASPARLMDSDSGWRVVFPIGPGPPLVSLLMPTRNGLSVLRPCVESVLRRTDYPRFELVIVDNQTDDRATLNYLASLGSDSRVRVLHYDAPFNFSAINNLAARHAEGSVLALLNNDLEVITPHWLSDMVAQAMRPEVGAVGAELYYPDGTIQHAGVVLGLGNVAGHLYRGLSCPPPEFGPMTAAVRRVSAVTAACMVLRADVYWSVGGLDETHLPIAFNDIDLCLRLRERGYRTIQIPHAKLIHHESATRGLEHSIDRVRRLRKEEAYMRRRWGAELDNDPTYNPNLALTSTSSSVAFPPRTRKTWRASEPRESPNASSQSQPDAPCESDVGA